MLALENAISLWFLLLLTNDRKNNLDDTESDETDDRDITFENPTITNKMWKGHCCFTYITAANVLFEI